MLSTPSYQASLSIESTSPSNPMGPLDATRKTAELPSVPLENLYKQDVQHLSEHAKLSHSPSFIELSTEIIHAAEFCEGFHELLEQLDNKKTKEKGRTHHTSDHQITNEAPQHAVPNVSVVI